MANELEVAGIGKLIAPDGWHSEDITTLKEQICKDLSNSELKLFLAVCLRTGLDPFAKQIYAIRRSGRMTIQTGIDGFRVIAARTGLYAGQTPMQWCGKDGVWRDVWLEETPPAAARCGVLHKHFREPLYRVATWKEYNPGNNPMWTKMPATMLAKCSEALSLRAAMPQDLSGLYIAEEMDQAGLDEVQQQHQQQNNGHRRQEPQNGNAIPINRQPPTEPQSEEPTAEEIAIAERRALLAKAVDSLKRNIRSGAAKEQFLKAFAAKRQCPADPREMSKDDLDALYAQLEATKPDEPTPSPAPPVQPPSAPPEPVVTSEPAAAHESAEQRVEGFGPNRPPKPESMPEDGYIPGEEEEDPFETEKRFPVTTLNLDVPPPSIGENQCRHEGCSHQVGRAMQAQSRRRCGDLYCTEHQEMHMLAGVGA